MLTPEEVSTLLEEKRRLSESQTKRAKELHQDIRRVAAGTLILAFICSASARAQTRAENHIAELI